MWLGAGLVIKRGRVQVLLFDHLAKAGGHP